MRRTVDGRAILLEVAFATYMPRLDSARAHRHGLDRQPQPFSASHLDFASTALEGLGQMF